MSGHADKVEAKTKHFMRSLAQKPARLNIAPEFQLFTFKLMAYIIFFIDLDISAEMNSELRRHTRH